MRRRTTTWMWAEACQALARTERLQQRFFEVETDAADAESAWQAPVDIFESGRDLIVWVALPGVAPDSVQIRVHGNTLRVSAFRSLSFESPSTRIRRLEIPHGRLERHIDLPQAGYVLEARDAIHGCMRLCLRRTRGGRR